MRGYYGPKILGLAQGGQFYFSVAGPPGLFFFSCGLARFSSYCNCKGVVLYTGTVLCTAIKYNTNTAGYTYHLPSPIAVL